MGEELWEGFSEEVALGNWQVQAGSERREAILGGEDSPSNVWQWEYRNRCMCKRAEEQVGAKCEGLCPWSVGQGVLGRGKQWEVGALQTKLAALPQAHRD